MKHVDPQSSLPFADLLDDAFRLYRAHFFALWSTTVRMLAFTFGLAVAPTILFSALWPLALLAFVDFGIGLTMLVDIIARLVSGQAAPRSTRTYHQLHQYASALGAYGVQLIVLLLPIALLIGSVFLLDVIYRDQPRPLGSADTPSEQMFYRISLAFIVLYPCFIAYIVSTFRLVVPAIVLEQVGPLVGLKRSWQLVRPSLRKPFLALLLILLLHGITQIPTLFLLWQWPISAGDPNQRFEFVLLAIASQSGLSVGLPIHAAIITLLYWDFSTRTQLDGGSGYPIRSGHEAPTIFGSLPAPQLGVVVDKHMRVLGVAAYSAAETAGIQPGDILDTLDGISILSHTQTVKDLIRTAQEDQAMHLRLIRNNISLEVIVVPFSSQKRIAPTLEPGQIPPTSTSVAAPDDYL
jgi:hypothetical protein